MERTDWERTGRGMGSEMARAPLGMVKEGMPPEKVTGWRVSGRMALDPAPLDAVPGVGGSATVAAVMVRSEPPKALLNWRRMVGADWVM